ncbi:MAG: NUDIX domain-containing protein [Campylobacterota bacterium]|nr:NUDIX domain-containing protein [Campylobacterota bacterium]
MKKITAFGICLYRVINKKNIEILLCKSVKSELKWGLLKGVSENKESSIQTALREFEEESSIYVDKKYLENYFEQKNTDKDIGIWLVDINNISNWGQYFTNGSLKENLLSWENSKAKFYNLNNLPPIKKKQITLIKDIKDYFENIHQYH